MIKLDFEVIKFLVIGLVIFLNLVVWDWDTEILLNCETVDCDTDMI